MEAAGPSDEPSEKLGNRRNILAVCISFFIIMLANSLWFSLFPIYLDKLGLTAVWIGAILTGYNASLSLTSMPSGRVSDIVGRRRPLILGGAITTASITMLHFLKSPIFVALSVVAYGIGMGLMLPSANALIAESAPTGQSGMAYAGFQISLITPAIFGSAAAGYLIQLAGFSALFLVSAAISLLALGTIAVFIRAPRPKRSESYGFAVKESLRSSVSGSYQLLKSNKELALMALGLCIHSFGFSILLPYVALFAQHGVGLSILQAGIIMALWNFGLLLAQVPSGKMTDRFGAKPTILTHVLLSSLSWLLYAQSRNFAGAVVTMAFFGVVGALDMPARRTMMVEYETAEAGKGTIIGTLDSLIGGVSIVAPIVGGALWTQFGYSAPFAFASVINLFAAVPLVLLLKKTLRK